MFSSITPQQASGLRLGGYLLLFIGLVSVFGWAGAIQGYYVTEHQWPAASAIVYSITERSKEVQPPSTRQRNYQVFWIEFLVVLDLPQGQCPGIMVPLTTPEPQCRGEVTTPHVRLRADAMDWAKRHPRGSTLIVHYDPQTRRMALGGESILDIYPWRKMSTTAMIFIVAALMIVAGRWRLTVPQKASHIPEIKEE
ncbi:MAG TPA: hypothetical protein VHV32_01275 [Candidatus Angelobacter sp.]|nr:hypothetical protein [Candidatus Angelobacter sp.]